MAQTLSANIVEDMEIGPLPGHPDMDYPAHERTYESFVFMFKWGTIFCVAVIVLLAVITL